MHPDNSIKEVTAEFEKLQWELALRSDSYEELHTSISNYVSRLITTDFPGLISVLYRLDISEKKLKELLTAKPGVPAGKLIATMIIARQLQKMEARRTSKQKADNIPDDEKW